MKKPFLKKIRYKRKKKQEINAKMPHVNKKSLAINGNLVQTKKLGLK